MYINVVICFVLYYSQKLNDSYPFSNDGCLFELMNAKWLSAFPAPASKKIYYLFILIYIAWVLSIDLLATVLP